MPQRKNNKARKVRRSQQAERLRQRLVQNKFAGRGNAQRREVAAIGIVLHGLLKGHDTVELADLVHDASLLLLRTEHPLEYDEISALQRAEVIVEGLVEALDQAGLITVDGDGTLRLTEEGKRSIAS